MSALFIWLWIAGGFPAAVLGEIVQAESPRIARAGRIAFAVLLWVDLLVAAVMFSVGNSAVTVHATRSIWWLTIVLGGVPLALVSGLAVRRGYIGHRLALAAATLTTAALYVTFPLAFIPADRPLTGLGRFDHDHHVIALAILLVPTLILLADELRRKRADASDPEAASPGFRLPAGVFPWRNFIAVGALLLILVWIAGTNSSGMLVGFGVVFGVLALFAWQRHRSAMRSALRDLKPPE